jgi:hypothetical protein
MASQFLLDFEEPSTGQWRHDPSASKASPALGIERQHNLDGNNASKFVLHCTLQEGADSGGLSFHFAENDVDTIPLTPDTRLAWNWKVSRNTSMNGFWILVRMRDPAGGAHFDVSAVNHIDLTHDAHVTNDPAQVWCYNELDLYSFLDERFGPLPPHLMIESISLSLVFTPSVEAWIDNIWIGEGTPPEGVNVSRRRDGRRDRRKR